MNTYNSLVYIPLNFRSVETLNKMYQIASILGGRRNLSLDPGELDVFGFSFSEEETRDLFEEFTKDMGLTLY